LPLAIALLAAWLIATPVALGQQKPANFPQPILTLVEQDNGRTVDIRLGELVRISLPENATTGYRWTIDRYDKDIIEEVATEPRYETNAVGSGGEIEFFFKGRKIGAGQIVLKHCRSWEGDQSISNRFQLRLQVKP
jgi:inhibitor of cysteine peptidase